MISILIAVLKCISLLATYARGSGVLCELVEQNHSRVEVGPEARQIVREKPQVDCLSRISARLRISQCLRFCAAEPTCSGPGVSDRDVDAIRPGGQRANLDYAYTLCVDEECIKRRRL